MRTAVTRVNRAYQRKIKTQFRKQKGIIHKYTEEIHKIQNTMVTVYLQQKQKMEFIGYMLWNYYL